MNARLPKIACLLLLLLTLVAPVGAQLRKINIAYTATSPYQAALIINTLIDMAQLNIPYQLTALTTMRGYIKDHPDIL